MDSLYTEGDTEEWYTGVCHECGTTSTEVIDITINSISYTLCEYCIDSKIDSIISVIKNIK